MVMELFFTPSVRALSLVLGALQRILNIFPDQLART